MQVMKSSRLEEIRMTVLNTLVETFPVSQWWTCLAVALWMLLLLQLQQCNASYSSVHALTLYDAPSRTLAHLTIASACVMSDRRVLALLEPCAHHLPLSQRFWADVRSSQPPSRYTRASLPAAPVHASIMPHTVSQCVCVMVGLSSLTRSYSIPLRSLLSGGRRSQRCS